MFALVIVWIGGIALALPVLCAAGRVAHRFDDEADDGLRRLMLRELARRRSDRRSGDRRCTAQVVEADRRRTDRRAGERREDRITNTRTITLNDHPDVVALPQPATAAPATAAPATAALTTAALATAALTTAALTDDRVAITC